MSASTITTRARPGEAVYREAAALRAAMVEERRGQVDTLVESRLAELGPGVSEDRRRSCELEARFDAFAELAPASVREEVQSMLERGAAPEELASGIEQMEEKAGDRYERREVSRLTVEDVAEKAGGSTEGTTAMPGGIATVVQFDDGHRMKAEVNQAGEGSPVEILWHAAGSDIPGCERQHATVRQAAVRSGMEVVGETGADTRPSRREASGGAG